MSCEVGIPTTLTRIWKFIGVLGDRSLIGSSDPLFSPLFSITTDTVLSAISCVELTLCVETCGGIHSELQL